jgi:phosphohistidine phosphatase
MKQLLLLRHGQAEEAHAGLTDTDRSLTLRGRAEALDAAHCIAAAQLRCEAVMVSPALRTTQTAGIIAAELNLPISLDIEPALYLGHPDALLAALRTCPSALASVLVVGHNPGLSELAQRFNGALDGAAEAIELRTAGLCVISLAAQASWQHLRPQLATAVRLLR